MLPITEMKRTMPLQAELLENMYRIWFSHENIDAIIYWNLVDGYTFNANGAGAGDLTSGENFFGGGLLYHDLSPKPAFETLNRLVNKEWRSLFNAETGADGRVSLRGFKGDYQIKAEKNGISSTCNAKISDGQNIIELILK